MRKELLEAPCGLSEFVEHTLLAIEAITEQIQQIDKALEALAKANPICQRLQTVPGVGVMTSLAFVYAVDEITRFANAHQLESYLGLTPGERSSSQRQRRLGITKAGPACVRYILSQAAWSVWSRDLRQRRQQDLSQPIDPLNVWAEAIAQRRNKQIANTALCRKLAGILFAIWRDGTTYDCRLVSKQSKRGERKAA